jgi:subtilisin family serine protease
MSCQIFAGEYVGTLLDEVRAIKYAADNGAVILQCSWGYTSGTANPYDWGQQFATDEEWELYNPLEKQALEYFVGTAGSASGVIEGGIAVFAGGNEAAPSAGYPGAYGKFVSVAGIAGDFTPAIYSNYGPGINISAPGGDQDYYFEFAPKDENGNVIKDYMGSVGCVLSTIPEWHTDSQIGDLDGDFYGYGYMEGTSMACPQVSGVIALGLSYALEQRKHFKAEEFIELLYSTATDVPAAVYDAEKFWYKYVIDMGDNHPNLTPLQPYKGKMGAGVANAEALLAAIDGTQAAPMTFPNVTLAVDAVRQINALIYFEKNASLSTVTVDDQSVATARIEGNNVVITGKAAGQTTAVVKAGSVEQKFVISVRNRNSGNGWL